MTTTANLPELKPLSIGNVDVGFPIVQAALSGYSDWPMRVIARRLGAPYTVCEVMLDKFLVELKVGNALATSCISRTRSIRLVVS